MSILKIQIFALPFFLREIFHSDSITNGNFQVLKNVFFLEYIKLDKCTNFNQKFPFAGGNFVFHLNVGFYLSFVILKDGEDPHIANSKSNLL